MAWIVGGSNGADTSDVEITWGTFRDQVAVPRSQWRIMDGVIQLAGVLGDARQLKAHAQCKYNSIGGLSVFGCSSTSTALVVSVAV